tara:strand:+ start:19 stop:174 length:156 start_codon:yes stop_codon:yes gene_type:complete
VLIGIITSLIAPSKIISKPGSIYSEPIINSCEKVLKKNKNDKQKKMLLIKN